MSSCFSRCLRVPIAMRTFYEPSLWILQHFLPTHPDLHHGLLGTFLYRKTAFRVTMLINSESCKAHVRWQPRSWRKLCVRAGPGPPSRAAFARDGVEVVARCASCLPYLTATENRPILMIGLLPEHATSA